MDGPRTAFSRRGVRRRGGTELDHSRQPRFCRLVRCQERRPIRKERCEQALRAGRSRRGNRLARTCGQSRHGGATVRGRCGGDGTDAGRRDGMGPGSSEREVGVARGPLSRSMGLDRAQRAGDARRCGDAAPTFGRPSHIQDDGGIGGYLLVSPCRDDLRDPSHRDGCDPSIERRTNARDVGWRWCIVGRLWPC